jgi:catechol 2,3-dioxygenase-like lactoylglutathione lyase family enzyme
MLEGANGRPAIALFAEPGSAAGGGRTIAFLTDRDGFLGFLDALGQRDLRDRNGHRVGPEALVDHDVAWSIYFRDPDGNHLELTTYDYAEVAKKIGRGAGEAGG